MGRLYFIALVSLALFGFMANRMSVLRPTTPQGASAGTTASGTDDTVLRTYSAARSGSVDIQPSGSDIVLERRGDGHFYAQVEVNGTPIEMMVDTGASGVALSQADARRVGIATSIGMRDYVGDGASGAVYGDMVKVERLRFGKVEMSDLEGAVLSGGETSLLGQDVLRQFDKVEIAGDRMLLH